MSFKCFLEVLDVVISDCFACRRDGCTDERKKWTMKISTFGISGHGYYTDGSSMEIPFCREYNCLSNWDSFLHVSPSTSKFDSRLYSFCTGIPRINSLQVGEVHWQNHIVSKVFSDELRVLSIYIIVERP